MSWRIVVISKRAKLELRLGYLVVRGESYLKIFIEEISVLIIENTGVSLTANLLSELSKKKVKVIFCDEKRNPHSELIPYYGSHDTSLKYKEQINWDKHTKALIWTEIVREKINKQMQHLLIRHLIGANVLSGYLKELEHNDQTNREGHAAKVYFNAMFGVGFARSYDNNINAALNYGYGILLSSFNREIVSNGYFTQLGLFHDNMFNQFNLSSDLMEPFRPLVDMIVVEMNLDEFGHDEKMEIVDLLNQLVFINNKKQYVSNAISIYCKSVFEALGKDDISLLRFYHYEL